MKCDACQTVIPPDDQSVHSGRACYMEALSPVKTCYPWAVHSAAFEEHMGGDSTVNAIQSEIFSILERRGGLGTADVLAHFKCKMTADAAAGIFRFAPHGEGPGRKKGERVFWRVW